VTKKWVGRGATDSFDPRQDGELVEENMEKEMRQSISKGTRGQVLCP
jgi:hypothetical protein